MACHPVAVVNKKHMYINMKQGFNKFKSGGLLEKHVVATWNLQYIICIHRLGQAVTIIITFINCNWVVTRWQ